MIIPFNVTKQKIKRPGSKNLKQVIYDLLHLRIVKIGEYNKIYVFAPVADLPMPKPLLLARYCGKIKSSMFVCKLNAINNIPKVEVNIEDKITIVLTYESDSSIHYQIQFMEDNKVIKWMTCRIYVTDNKYFAAIQLSNSNEHIMAYDDTLGQWLMGDENNENTSNKTYGND